ncbi:MAG: Cof-type HAD-IIB family hydrolase [Candidatus Gastranaerophilales bacterium]|nr:Cof-type HAD-IIB family hydrolase [Candidatus Gastranaerophilales bacterium]
MPIKLIALDIDGTIMDNRFQISDRVKKTISRAIDSGIYVVIATGRMYSATVPIASGLGIVTPLITYQGSMVREFCEKDDILLHYDVSPDLSKQILDELRKFEVQINLYLDDELFIEDESAILAEYATKRNIIYHKVNSFNNIINLKPTKILAMIKNAEKATEIKNYLKEKYSDILYITKSTPFYVEIVNKEASKGRAVLFLANKWGIDQAEIMTIGDQDNDSDMLEVAGLSVAMGNGTEGLKKIAKYVTDTVDNDGAALAIEKFVLNF